MNTWHNLSLFHFQQFQSSSHTSTTPSLFPLKFCYSHCLGVVVAVESLYPLRMAIIYCCKSSDPCRDPATMFMQISAVLWPWIIPVDTVSTDYICSWFADALSGCACILLLCVLCALVLRWCWAWWWVYDVFVVPQAGNILVSWSTLATITTDIATNWGWGVPIPTIVALPPRDKIWPWAKIMPAMG